MSVSQARSKQPSKVSNVSGSTKISHIRKIDSNLFTEPSIVEKRFYQRIDEKTPSVLNQPKIDIFDTESKTRQRRQNTLDI